MRASGILLPVSSLPGKYGIGCFSKEAYDFVDVLEKANQKYWQILPIGPTSYGDSPYQSFSTFAGNPYFISLEKLIEEELLTEEECNSVDFGENNEYIDYEKLYNGRFNLLKKAYKRSNPEDEGFKKFVEENGFWIEDYAMFMTIKAEHNGESFELWEDEIRVRKPEAMERYREKFKDEILFYKFIQFKFYEQWFKLKEYANDKGIKIIGDIPIYVAYDSADVWSNPELFQMDEEVKPISVAGCPPDAFSVDGQLWGNPVYKWDYHKQTGYTWWIKRIENSTKLYDVIRIDHFRGFDEYYAIPSGEETAVNGKWDKGPGMDLFRNIEKALGKRDVIAEDLGFVTDSVRKLVHDSGFPGMKVVEFAFDVRDTGAASDYLPHNYIRNCVVYTGTHDNETLIGWWSSIDQRARDMARDYMAAHYTPDRLINVPFITLAMRSIADLCIIPMQDYLGLDNRSRMNKPSTVGDNWRWRTISDDTDDDLAEEIGRLTLMTGRSKM